MTDGNTENRHNKKSKNTMTIPLGEKFTSQHRRRHKSQRPSSFTGRSSLFDRITIRFELICPSGVVPIFLSSPFCKNISVFVPPKSHLELSVSRPTKRGVSRSSRTLGAGCDGRGSILRAMGSQGG